MYEVTGPNLYRDPKTPKLVGLDGDEVQGQLRLSPKGSDIPLPPLTSVKAIELTLENCPATDIEQKGNDYANGTESSYVRLPFDWCVIYSFELCGDRETQLRKNVGAIPTPPPSSPSLPIPHAAVAKSRPPVPSVVVGSKRKFVDNSNPPECSINPARRIPHFPCVLPLIVLHIKH